MYIDGETPEVNDIIRTSTWNVGKVSNVIGNEILARISRTFLTLEQSHCTLLSRGTRGTVISPESLKHGEVLKAPSGDLFIFMGSRNRNNLVDLYEVNRGSTAWDLHQPPYLEHVSVEFMQELVGLGVDNPE